MPLEARIVTGLRKGLWLISLGLAGVWAVPVTQAGQGPRLICDAPVFEYGRVANTQEVEHVFQLRNGGDAPLEIGRIYSGCGCTRTQIDATNLVPGATATVAVVFHLRGRSGARIINIFVSSNDPVDPVFRLQCRGHTYFSEQDRVAGLPSEWAVRAVYPFAPNGSNAAPAGLTLIPPELVLNETDTGRFPVRYVMLRARGQHPFQVLSVTAPEIGTNGVALHQTGAGWATVRVGPLPVRPAWSQAVIRVTTDMPGFEALSIPITLRGHP